MSQIPSPSLLGGELVPRSFSVAGGWGEANDEGGRGILLRKEGSLIYF